MRIKKPPSSQRGKQQSRKIKMPFEIERHFNFAAHPLGASGFTFYSL